MDIALGTYNQKKKRELDLLLGPLGFHLRSLDEFDSAIEVEETGNSFAENAALKATEQAKAIKQWTIGEDSGLSVRALDNRPGIYSSRYSGENATDQTNNQKLLEELKSIPLEKRQAFYTSHIALSDPEGNLVIQCEDYCHGLIDFEEHGSAGFGYDPLFIIPEYNLSFGQLGDHVKSILSHRARAIRKFIPQLLTLKHNLNNPANV